MSWTLLQAYSCIYDMLWQIPVISNSPQILVMDAMLFLVNKNFATKIIYLKYCNFLITTQITWNAVASIEKYTRSGI